MKTVFAIGVGPGRKDWLTMAALETLEKCTFVAGYKLYLDGIKELLTGKKVVAGVMGQEIERCRAVLDAALNGETAAIISSGDAGIYGMAGLLLELCELPQYNEIDVAVIPGITASVAAAAVMGAPLMNDFAVISLSDLMTPRELIIKRLEAAASCSMVTALYNPVSRKRKELFPLALEIFRKYNDGNLPVAAVNNIGREGEELYIGSIDDFPQEKVGMTTLVIIGNSDTVVHNGRFYCRRGYRSDSK